MSLLHIHLAFQAEHSQDVGPAGVFLEEVHLYLTIPLGLALLVWPVLCALDASQLNTSGGGGESGESIPLDTNEKFMMCTQLWSNPLQLKKALLGPKRFAK